MAQDVEYLGQRVRVVAAVEQHLRAAVVGLLLEVAAEAVDGCLQPDRDHTAPYAEPAEHHAGDRGLLVRAVVDEPVVTGDMGDLVREQRRELIFVLKPRKHAGMHVDVAVRQREGVRRRVTQHVELVLDVVVGRMRVGSRGRRGARARARSAPCRAARAWRNRPRDRPTSRSGAARRHGAGRVRNGRPRARRQTLGPASPRARSRGWMVANACGVKSSRRSSCVDRNCIKNQGRRR